jgi:hypothetical protein
MGVLCVLDRACVTNGELDREGWSIRPPAVGSRRFGVDAPMEELSVAVTAPIQLDESAQKWKDHTLGLSLASRLIIHITSF